MLALALNGATRDELARAIKQKPAAAGPAPPPDKRTRVVCPIIASGISVTVSGPAFGIAGLIAALEESLSMARKANNDNLTVRLAHQTWQRRPGAKPRKRKAS